ncbi:hypothetical protein HNQ35_002840 [Cerasibacillus quisquiliarum]|nr:hypothetical protein [Cerasibacillus quisquiliarum]
MKRVLKLQELVNSQPVRENNTQDGYITREFLLLLK